MENEPTLKFAFGKNWEKYLDEHLSEEAIKSAEDSLKCFLGKKDLKGRTFLDVGCGSGIHSLAAIRLGATKVLSIDVDDNSVACCERLAKDISGVDWEVLKGSMLETEFMRSLGTFDIVYCWGVAHHTGNMWLALDNLKLQVAIGGSLFIAIYNTLDGWNGSRMWLNIKHFYVKSSEPMKWLMEWGYVGLYMLKLLSHLKNPFTVFKRYKDKRGMSYKHDLIDWLGGYPYEHARVEELFHFYRKRGFELVNLKTDCFTGNNQLIFKRK